MAKVRVDGLKELNVRLKSMELDKQKSVVQKVLRESATPIVTDAKSGAPVGAVDNGGIPLNRAILASNKLSARQQRSNPRPRRGEFEVYVGAAPADVVPHSHLQEFGTRHHAPQPFMRSAFESNKMTVLQRIKDGLAAALTRIGR